MPPEEARDLWGEIWLTFEPVRNDIYNLMTDSSVDQYTSKRMMQLAFVTYSSQPTPGYKRSVWTDQIVETASHHAQMIALMIQGRLDSHLAFDPRDSKEADEKVSLSTMPGAGELNAQKTWLDDERAARVNISEKSRAQVGKFVKNLRERAAQRADKTQQGGVTFVSGATQESIEMTDDEPRIEEVTE